MRAWIVVAFVAAGCGDNRRDTPYTPEEIVQTATDGKVVTVEGTVHTLTFNNEVASDGEFVRLPDRYLLIRSVAPDEVRLDSDHFDGDALLLAWGLGVRILEDELDDRPLPQIGAKVRVTGTFDKEADWAGKKVPVIEDATIEILEGALVLGMVGATCDNDLDCHEQLICDRATTKCAAPPPGLVWGSAYRDVNGACDTDADCPLPQICDTRYTMQNDGGTYAPPYFAAEDAGKHLCVLPDDATIESVCPHIYTSADLSGGRLAAGKEVCVRHETWLAVAAEDGDTHLQVTTEEPLPYPFAEAAYWIFGSTTENAPPYKDPARPQPPVVDPELGAVTVSVGTMRYDSDHGWWEVHPVKRYFPVSAGRGTADMERRYKTWPRNFDAEAWEEIEGGPYKVNLKGR